MTVKIENNYLTGAFKTFRCISIILYFLSNLSLTLKFLTFINGV